MVILRGAGNPFIHITDVSAKPRALELCSCESALLLLLAWLCLLRARTGIMMVDQVLEELGLDSAGLDPQELRQLPQCLCRLLLLVQRAISAGVAYFCGQGVHSPVDRAPAAADQPRRQFRTSLLHCTLVCR